MRSVYSASNNMEIFIGNDTDEVIDRLFDTILKRFQEARETSFERESKFIFENVDLLYYYFHKIDMKRSGSYMKTPEWLQNKKATINPKSINDNDCFQYSIPLALDHEDIGRDPHRISKIIPFINKYNWKGTKFPAESKDWKNLNKIMRQLNSIYFVYLTTRKKYVVRTNQNTTMNAKFK